MRRLALSCIALAAVASAADKRLYLSSFDRLRVEGPYHVLVTGGRSPGGTLSGDAPALRRVEVNQDGNVVVIRDGSFAEQGRSGTPVAATVTLATPALASVQVIGAGEVVVSGLRAARADVSVAGTGAITVTGVDASDLYVTNVGNGTVTLAGRVDKAHVTVNGAGSVKADALDASELTARLDGPGEIAGRARYTAAVSSSGLGRVTIAGNPKCTVRAVAGPVVCGVR